MSDLLIKLNRNPATSRIMKALGMPNPIELERAAGGYTLTPLKGKRALLVSAEQGTAAAALSNALTNAGATLVKTASSTGGSVVDVVVVDASGCRTPDGLHVLYDAFHPIMRQIVRNGRVLLVGPIPATAPDPIAAASAQALAGFSRALGKELGKRGITANLVYLHPDAVDRLEGAVRFFCGAQTTYVSGQAIEITPAVAPPATLPFSDALAGKVALVTGSARGIGEATAERLAQEGAHVVCLDVESSADHLRRTCSRIGATPLVLDICAADAPAQLVRFFQDKFGGVDIVVHNAGIARDRTLANMQARDWDMVIGVNFAAVGAIDQMLVEAGVLRDGGRIVCLSSVSGIAGNFGQTNYATAKAALIGYVSALAPRLASRGICVNAVAPGFIETAMTDKMPFLTREIGRRLNSLQQGGKPRDAAELITFLCTPGAYGVTGETIRVCGQALIGV